MKIKIFTPNENGKIELTKDELEALLNESYRQGWNDRPYNNGFYYSYPSITLTGSNADTTYSSGLSSTTNTCAETLEKDIEAFKVALKEREVKGR